jgi:hypothetical protein
MRATLFLLAVSAFGQTAPANFINAKIETRSYSGNLDTEIRSVQPAWFAYQIALVKTADERNCSMEDAKPISPVALEGSTQGIVLIRTESGQISKVRLAPSTCALNAGGLPVIWINGVPAAASVAYLEKIGSDGAIFALAQHAAPEADTALDRLTQPQQPEKKREKVVFWLGASRGAKGELLLSRIVKDDPSENVRDKAIFALSISPQPEALTVLIDEAKHDKSSHLRSQALFWLARKAGQRSSQTISDAIENDPDVAVKKQAVFALTQLPKEEGIPRLIQVASTQKSPDVRKQAFFWLGQSNDPRALAFVEQVLTK